MVTMRAPGDKSAVDGTKHNRWIDSHNWALTLLAASVAPVCYLAFVLRFAVDALVGDEWNMIPFIDSSLHGNISTGTLWSQYGEPRIPSGARRSAHVRVRRAPQYTMGDPVQRVHLDRRLCDRPSPIPSLLRSEADPDPRAGYRPAWFSFAHLQTPSGRSRSGGFSSCSAFWSCCSRSWSPRRIAHCGLRWR